MGHAHSHHRRATGALLLAAALLAPSPAPAQEVSNPDLFTKSLQASTQALEQFGAMEDREAMARVAEIGYRIAAESGFTAFPITFHLIEMPVPNAFALPGGQIFLTRGMLDLDLDDDMLAALLGHEIAHVVREHGIRMRRRATLLNAISQAVLVGVIVGASDSGGGARSTRDPPAAIWLGCHLEGDSARVSPVGWQAILRPVRW